MIESKLPVLPCPDCRMRGISGARRIGHKRNQCETCNNWAQAVMRLTRKRFKDRYPDLYEDLRMAVELDLYPRVIEDFAARYPTPADYERDRSAKSGQAELPGDGGDVKVWPEHQGAPGIDRP